MAGAGKRTGELGCSAGGEDSAGDGSGLFPHLAFVLFCGYIPQAHRSQLARGWGEQRGSHACLGHLNPKIRALVSFLLQAISPISSYLS